MMLLAQRKANEVEKVAVKAETLMNDIRSVNLLLYNIYCSKRLGTSEVAKRLGVVSGELAAEARELLKEGERLNDETKGCYDDIAPLKEQYTDLSKPLAQKINAVSDGALEASINPENACVRVRAAAKEVRGK